MGLKYKITSGFHSKEPFRDHLHNGVDLKMAEGTDLRAVVDGTVRITDYGNTNAGKTVFIDAADGKTYIYGHLSDFAVSNGQTIHVGELIGHSGNSGFSTGPHLHFGVKEDGHYLDPTPYVQLLQDMNKGLKEAAHSSMNNGLSALDMLNEALGRFSETLSEMTLNVIVSLEPAIHKGLQVLDLVLSLIC
ncbi:metallopeptidase [Bacillus phage 000TH008]|nr:metallopeptidase [Bacillus phage 000TH008]QQO40770.1 metallopeptidase [Bacillus phage 000TH009]